MFIIRLLHIIVSFWFIAGLLGRWLAYAQATRTSDVQTTGVLLRLSDRFEQLMVIPGSQIVLLLGLLTGWLQGQPLLGSLTGARSNWLLVSLILFVGLTPIVMALLVPRRKRRHAALDAALTFGAITPELRTAIDDKVVTGSRALELLIVNVILVLMITKPF